MLSVLNQSNMNHDNVPSNLRHLIPFVEKWSIEDDGIRDNLIYNSPNVSSGGSPYEASLSSTTCMLSVRSLPQSGLGVVGFRSGMSPAFFSVVSVFVPVLSLVVAVVALLLQSVSSHAAVAQAIHEAIDAFRFFICVD